MSRVLNRRNALLGWVAWKLIRRQAKRKAKDALPLADGEPRRNRIVALLLGAATAAGLVLLWRKLRGGDEEWRAPEPVASPEPDSVEPTPLTAVGDDDIPPAA